MPNAYHHPKIQHNDHADGTESYLLPDVLAMQNGAEITARYPGPCIYYVTEGEIQYEDTKIPGNITVLRKGDVIHVEEGSLIRWMCKSPTGVKGFGVAYVPVSVKFINDFVVTDQ
ncbi:hypothetical protein JR316_0011227 [Psilocybe cubensis]|nr:hypothetical protein JR316_0011227 [Psilocybe cubensis]KAH9475668.1 hypothetical protein JR316_0011227 [Psilocybe cubensis]